MRKHIIKLIFTIVMIVAFAVPLAGCGNGGTQEETVEITTVAEGVTQPTEAEKISVYESIYQDYKDQLKAAGDRKALDKVFEKGKKKMTDAMISSTKDDQDTYQKWFNKLNEVYSDCARAITN